VDDFNRDRDELNHFEVETEIYKISPEEMEQIKISPSAIVSMEFMIGISEEEKN